MEEFRFQIPTSKRVTLSGAGEVASGVFMRLVSLWWELPPRLDSNISIWFCGMQQFFVFSRSRMSDEGVNPLILCIIGLFL